MSALVLCSAAAGNPAATVTVVAVAATSNAAASASLVVAAMPRTNPRRLAFVQASQVNCGRKREGCKCDVEQTLNSLIALVVYVAASTDQPIQLPCQ